MRDLDALIAYLAERAGQPFDWATNTCVQYAAGAVKAQTGRDVLDGLPTWKTERGAQRVLAHLGGLITMTDRLLRPVAIAQAMRGDIAGVRTEDGGILLMVVEGDLLSGPDASGARKVARSRMVLAWSAE